MAVDIRILEYACRLDGVGTGPRRSVNPYRAKVGVQIPGRTGSQITLARLQSAGDSGSRLRGRCRAFHTAATPGDGSKKTTLNSTDTQNRACSPDAPRNVTLYVPCNRSNHMSIVRRRPHSDRRRYQLQHIISRSLIAALSATGVPERTGGV